MLNFLAIRYIRAIIEKFSLRTSLCYEQDEVIIANTEQNVSCRKMDYDSQHI